jgi:hypothetical protein
MAPETENPARGGAAGFGDAPSSADDNQEITQSRPQTQAKILPLPGAPPWRHKPGEHRWHVRITALHGRTRPIYLTDHALHLLIRKAVELEAMA